MLMKTRKNVKKKTDSEVPSTEVAVTVPAPKPSLVLEGDPEAQLAFAQKAASALMRVVGQKPKKVMINGKQYLEFGDWQTLGRFFGSTVGIEWTRPLEGSTRGYEARAIVYHKGEIISSAEAMCTRAERRWASAEDYAVRSMAQTRASAKALRNAFGWVAELAGYQSTPAEEMPNDNYDQSPVADDVPVVSYGAEEDPQPVPMTELQKKQRIVKLLKEKGVDVTDKKACEYYIADATGLALVEGNYDSIITSLESL